MKKHILMTVLMTILVTMSILVTSVCVYAAPDESYTVTANFATENGPVDGAEFRIYRALNDEGELTGDFAGYDVEVGDLNDSESLGKLGDTLAAYAARDSIAPKLTGHTNVIGEAVFSGLEKGIYLVCGNSVIVGNTLYIPKPSLVRVPYVSQGELVTNVVLEIKYDRRELGAETIERSVVKVWDDRGYSRRPTEVTVQLLRNGELFDTVTLNEQCDWRYKWTGLDPGFDWQITEDEVPLNYLVSITLDETVFTVTNRLRQGLSDGEVTAPAVSTSRTALAQIDTITTESSASTNTTTTAATTVTTTKLNSSTPTLPQTGQLWWPVPILFIVGALLLVVGVIDRNLE